MSYLYLCENGATVGVEENYVVVSYSDGMKKKIPVETLESIQIFGHASMTSPCITQCLKKGFRLCTIRKAVHISGGFSQQAM